MEKMEKMEKLREALIDFNEWDKVVKNIKYTVNNLFTEEQRQIDLQFAREQRENCKNYFDNIYLDCYFKINS